MATGKNDPTTKKANLIKKHRLCSEQADDQELKKKYVSMKYQSKDPLQPPFDTEEGFISWAKANGWTPGSRLSRRGKACGFLPYNIEFIPQHFEKPTEKNPVVIEQEPVDEILRTWKKIHRRASLAWQNPDEFRIWSETHGWVPGARLNRFNHHRPYSSGNCIWFAADTRKNDAPLTDKQTSSLPCAPHRYRAAEQAAHYLQSIPGVSSTLSPPIREKAAFSFSLRIDGRFLLQLFFRGRKSCYLTLGSIFFMSEESLLQPIFTALESAFSMLGSIHMDDDVLIWGNTIIDLHNKPISSIQIGNIAE